MEVPRYEISRDKLNIYKASIKNHGGKGGIEG